MDDAIDLIEPRSPDGLGFLLKARATGRLYRLMPARDPRQPRFWCFTVYRCTSAGVVNPTERPWLGAGGMTREELPVALAAIHEDVGAWLAKEECHELRTWLLASDAASADPPRPEARVSPAARRRPTAVAPAAVAPAGARGLD